MSGREALDVAVLAMGGTIDKVYDLAGRLVVGPPAAAQVLRRAGAAHVAAVAGVVAKDSLDLTDDDREELLRRIVEAPQHRVVVTHGTDTLVRTARYLDARGSAMPGTTVVLTGALQPAAMRATDADLNLGAALVAAQTCAAGVHVCMGGQVLPAGNVRKDRRTGRFVAVDGLGRAAASRQR